MGKYGFICKCTECTLHVSERKKRDGMISKYVHLLSHRVLRDVEMAMDILDDGFKGHPVLKMNLLSRCADILMDADLDDEGTDLCLEYIQRAITVGLTCYGDKKHNKSDWSETRKRIAILRWYGDPNGKCTEMLEKWQHLF